MVAWESNPTAGFLIADLGPYIGSDWPPAAPDLNHRFPADAGEVDYYVLDPAVDDYLTMGYTPSGPAWSNSYAWVNFSGFLHSGAYTDGSSSGPPSGAHIYVAWYDVDYNTVPAAPSVTPESLIPSSYSALGTLGPLVTHWGPWITPPAQTFNVVASGNAGRYLYEASPISIADAIAHPLSEEHGSAVWGWIRDRSSFANPFTFTIGTIDVSFGLTQYAQENNPGVTVGQQGFYNAQPTLPADAVLVQHEVTWDHTTYADMLASVIGDAQIDLMINDAAASGVVAQDVNLLVWTEAPSAMQVADTFYGFVERTAGVPTQTDLDAAYAAAPALIPMDATTSSIIATLHLPVSDFYTGMVPYRDDLAPSVRIAIAIAEGVQGVDPPEPTDSITGRELAHGGASLTVTYQPPRYRFQLVGPAVDVAGWQVGSVAW